MGVYHLSRNLASVQAFDLRARYFNIFDLCVVYLRNLGVDQLPLNLVRLKVLDLGVRDRSVLNLSPIDVCNLGIDDLTGDLVRFQILNRGAINHCRTNLGAFSDERLSLDQLVGGNRPGSDCVPFNRRLAVSHPIHDRKLALYNNLTCSDLYGSVVCKLLGIVNACDSVSNIPNLGR